MNLEAPHPKPKPARKVKTKKPVVKVSSRGSLIKTAHSIMRDIVLDRDLRCVCPPPAKGHSGARQAGHLIKSTKGKIRFDLMNVHEQCSACNGRHNNYEHYYVDWFISKFGADEYHRLCADAEGVGLKTYELEELIAQLKEIRRKQVAATLMGETYKPYYTQADVLSGAWRLK